MIDIFKKIIEEQTMEQIKQNENSVPKLVPSIVEMIKSKYGKKVRVKVTKKKIHYGSDNYTATCPIIEIFVLDEYLVAAELKFQTWNDIQGFFGIDLGKYGACLYLEVYKQKWERV